MTARTIAAALLAAMLAAGCQTEGDAGDGTSADEAAPAVPVEVATAVRSDIYATYSGTAPIEAFAEATVIAKVGGEVREILVEEGDAVNAGQTLARLDGDRLRLELAQSEARLEKLRRDYERNLDLREKGLISAGDFEKIRYEMQALEASNELARLELGYTRIRAPIDGVIAERYIKLGNTIEINTPAFHVASLEPLVVYLHVPEREYRRIAPGMAVTLEIDALGNERFQANVARIGPVIDPETGTFKITVEISEPGERLKPGMFARLSIVSDMHADALQVPRSAIVEDGGNTSVFVVEGDLVAKRPVRTGYAANGRIEVIDGLRGNERVVVVGQTGLRDGSRVTVVNPDDGGASAAALPDTVANDDG